MRGRIPAEPRPWGRALLWLLGLGVLFFTTYNTANWLASQRSHVPSIVFAWESLIPYWPWTIIPYWSIDLFYCASLFVCTTRRELDTHACRLFAAQVISVLVFVLAPLRYTVERPETTGVYGALFDALLLFDKPFNQAPALHISLLIVLWVRYHHHLRGAWRWMLHVWFALIGVSVLTTWQHHFFDIPTGAWLGLFCIWLFPDHTKSLIKTFSYTDNTRRRQLATRYGIGAVTIVLVAVTTGGWALWLLWAAGSLLLVSMIYAGLDASAFLKNTNGRMRLASLLLFAPYRAGAWLNSRWWTRRANAADAVVPQVWIGRLPAHAHELPAGVNTVIDLCAELPCTVYCGTYIHIPALDLVPLAPDQLTEAAQSITRGIAAGPVLVCCALGYARSAAAIAAWLITSGQVATAREAVERIRKARPQVVLDDRQCLSLDELTMCTTTDADTW